MEVSLSFCGGVLGMDFASLSNSGIFNLDFYGVDKSHHVLNKNIYNFLKVYENLVVFSYYFCKFTKVFVYSKVH